MKRSGSSLLPHSIITDKKYRIRNNEPDQNLAASPISDEETTTQATTATGNTESSPEPPPHTTTNDNSMADPVLLARARKARYDNLPTFSGHPSENAERFLKSIKRLAKVTDDSPDQLFLEIVRGKLTQDADTWFDDNEPQFTKWSDFETAFRNRYFSTTIGNTKFDKLFQRKQGYDESVTAYFDDIIALCREVDLKMPNDVIIQHLMKGINPEIRKELTRLQSSMSIPSDFLKFAKLEQDLHDTFIQSQGATTQPEPLMTYHLSSNGKQISTHNNSKYQQQNHAQQKQNVHPTAKENHNGNWNSYSNVPRHTSDKPINNNPKGNIFTRNRPTRYRSDTCKVCGRQNHRSIDCTHRRPSGYYNCGQQHSVRDCPNPPHFY